VYEQAERVGGLATWHDFGPFTWDRFYHVILPSDAALIAYLRDLGLGDELRWSATRTGYYVGGRFYSLSSGFDFLRFPLLGPVSKFRLAATILYCSRLRDWRRLERITVEDFLVRTSGRATFEAMWKPLLLAKLGEHYRRVSAVFIWSYIKRLFSARDPAVQKEHLGHVAGGYRRVFERLLDVIHAGGGSVQTGLNVQHIRAAGPNGVEVVVPGTVHRHDKVIFTGPVDAMRRVADPSLVAIPAPTDVEYLGVVCLVLVTRRPITPYYVLNIGDTDIPFTGVIGMSSVVARDQTAGHYLTYFPKYVLSTDPLLRQPDDELRTLFQSGLARLYPDLAAADVQSAHINRAGRVQPLQVIGYSEMVQPPRTQNPDFYVLNTSQIVSGTLNNNEVIRAVHAFLDHHAADFRAAAPAQPQPTAAGIGI